MKFALMLNRLATDLLSKHLLSEDVVSEVLMHILYFIMQLEIIEFYDSSYFSKQISKYVDVYKAYYSNVLV